MRTLLTACSLLALTALILPAPALAADATAEQVVDAHFKAILAEDWDGAETYFSDSFLRAFRDSAKRTDGATPLQEYFVAREQQLRPGYRILETAALADTDHQATMVMVDFGDPNKDAPLAITERMYYYLVRQPVKAKAFGAGQDGQAWRIDIFDALHYDTLAEARRRPYLYTAEAWPENAGKLLRSRQGLFRVQWALGAYHDATGHYPPSLAGGSANSDELAAGNYMPGGYPSSGFSGTPMSSVEVNAHSPGDFTYIPVYDDSGAGSASTSQPGTSEVGKQDQATDSQSEPQGQRPAAAATGYWLLLHGADASDSYYSGYEIAYVQGSADLSSQYELAQAFAQWWQATYGTELPLTPLVQPKMAVRQPSVPPAHRWARASGRHAGSTVLVGQRRLRARYVPPAASVEVARQPELVSSAEKPLLVYSYGF